MGGKIGAYSGTGVVAARTVGWDWDEKGFVWNF